MKKKFMILNDIDSGNFSIRQLASKYKCSPETIIRIKKQGWEYVPHGRKKPIHQAMRIRRMYEEGLSVKGILFRLRREGVSESTIRSILFKPDRELEEHIKWYVEYGRWKLVKKYIDGMYTVGDKSLLSRIPVEMLSDFQIVQRVEYEMANVDVEIRELIDQLDRLIERLKDRKSRSFYRAIALKIYLLPQLRNSRKDVIEYASRLFEEYKLELEKEAENYFLLALSTYCLHLLSSCSSRFMGYTNKLIKKFQTVKSPLIKHLLMTRLRLLGFPQYADEEDPSQIISILFRGDLDKVEEIYNRYRYTDIQAIKNRLNYAMFYSRLLKGKVKEAEIFLKRFAEVEERNGLADISISIAKAHFDMVTGKRQQAFKKLQELADNSMELKLLFGRESKAITPRHRVAKYYADGKLKEAYRVAKKYNLMGLLMMAILTRPKYIARLRNFPELEPLYNILTSKDARVKVYLLQRKPRMVHLKDTIYLTREQTMFLLKFLDRNEIKMDNRYLRRVNRVVRMLKKSCVIIREQINGETRFWLKERNIYYDIDDLEERYNRILMLEGQNRMEEASMEKRKAKKLIQAIPFFQQACRDIEASYILDRILKQIKYISA